MTTINLNGRVVNEQTGEGITGLRVQAWGRIGDNDRQLDGTGTNNQGRFVLEFDIPDQVLQRNPVGVIKVLSGDKLLHTTSEVPIADWEQFQPVIIELEAPKQQAVELYVYTSRRDGTPMGDVQLILNYSQPDGGFWSSPPATTNNQGALTLTLPGDVFQDIDWRRMDFAFTYRDRPLRIIQQGRPDPTGAGFAITFVLARGTVDWPPPRDPNKWYITGKVSSANGEPIQADVSASAIRLSEVKPLGQVQTDKTGRYEIVYEWEHKCLPDIQVTANVNDKPIAQSPIHFAAAKSLRIDLTKANEDYIGLTEYQQVEQRVLACNDDFKIEIIGPDQYEYLLGKTRLAQDVLTDYLLAQKLASGSDVPGEVFYGLFRAKLPNSLQGLLAQTPQVLNEAIETSINHNIIDRKHGKAVKPLLASLQQMAVQGSLDSKQQLGYAGVGDLLSAVRVPKNAHEKLVNLYFDHQGDDASFWETLRSDEQLARQANKIKLGLQAGALALYHPPTVEKLTAQLGNNTDIKTLAGWQDEDWKAFAQELDSVPASIPGKTKSDQIANYVNTMQRSIRRSFANQHTTAGVLGSDTFSSSVLHEFLDKTPDFDYANSNVPAILNKSDLGDEHRAELEKTLKPMQRLYRVAPLENKFEVVESLYAGGVFSSRDIVIQGQTQFVDSYASQIGGPDVAASVYNNAMTVTATATNVFSNYGDLFNSSAINAIGGGVPVAQPDDQSDLAIPTYQDLFGSQSYCQCEHCSSVYSPAAYLADLLEYLRQSLVTRKIGGGGFVKITKDGQRVNKTGLDVLFRRRRADLGEIQLNCQNTNTVLPYIDLVNEIFERAVAGQSASESYQTNWNEPELKANPEHILTEAYDKLADTTTTYPLSLPFHLWNVEAAHYLNHLDTPRWQIMDTIKSMPDSADSSFSEVCFAHMNLSATDVKILRGEPEYSGSLETVGKMWGYTNRGWRNELARVPVFIQRSGLDYDGLQALLQTEFVNPGARIVIDFSEAESACDIDGAVLRYLDEDGIQSTPISRNNFDRMQRFLRLQLKTGWSIWELGRVMTGLSITRLTQKAIIQMATVKRIADAYAQDVIEVCSWWADMDTAIDATDEQHRSFYESVFVNSAVLNPPNEVFLLEQTDRTKLVGESTGALISEHLSSIAAALQVTQTQAGLLAETLINADGDIDDNLTLANLSQLHRITSLCRAVDIDIEDYLLLVRLIGNDWQNPGTPKALIEFMELIELIHESPFSITELAYLLLHDEASVNTIQIPESSVVDRLTEIQSAVRAVWARYADSNAGLIDQLSERLGDYFVEDDIDHIMALVGQDEPYTADDIADIEAALAFLERSALAAAIDQNLPTDVRYQNLLNLLNAYGRRVSSINVVSQIISETFALDLTVAQQILTEVISRNGSSEDGIIEALLDPLFIDSGKEKLAAVLDVEYRQVAFDILENSSSLTDAEIEQFIIQHFDFLDPQAAIAALTGSDALADPLKRYQYVTGDLDPAAYEITDQVFNEQFQALRVIQKTALLAGHFDLGQEEVVFLNDHAGDLKVLPLTRFPFTERPQNFQGFKAWVNLYRLLTLRESIVNPDNDLITLLEQAADPALIDTDQVNPEVDELIDGGTWAEADRILLLWLYDFSAATDWPFAELVYVAGNDLLNASLSDLLDVASLVYLSQVSALAAELGTTVNQLVDLSKLDVTQDDAANAKQTARARYSIDQWYEVAPGLRDVLREQQRDALTAYMLYRGGFGSTVELYNHYLIDSQMSACMLTSRLKLALSSVQLFLQRCLLNLEDEFVAVDQPDEWEWRKNYRVWEANRKVFLYPENYIRPELRISRSQVFDASQSVLLQNEVTEEVAQQSLLRYLENLDEVSNLEVVGSYHEQTPAEDGLPATDRLHVVARTRGIPHKYFYRQRDGKTWLPWSEIDVDIDAHQVLPLVVNRRLYLFWPMFFEKQTTGVDVLTNKQMKDAKDAVIQNYDNYLDYLYDSHHDLDFDIYVKVAEQPTPNELGTIPAYTDFTDEIKNYAEDKDYDVNDLAEFLGLLAGTTGSLSDSSYGSLQSCADAILNITRDEAITLLLDVTDALTWDQYQNSVAEGLEGKFEQTINYFEIKLNVSEYKNGNWLPVRSSEDLILSDQKNTALALLDDYQTPVTTDFHFYSTVLGDTVTVQCLQTLRHSDYYPYIEGEFQYNALSKAMVAVDYKDDRSSRIIDKPTNADLLGNRFVEKGKHKFEIPLVEGAWYLTSYQSLLERTPGTFKVPLQHQYEQFTDDDDFFYGDDKRSYLVSTVLDTQNYQYSPSTYTDNSLSQQGYTYSLEDFIYTDKPSLGVYQDFNSNVLTGNAIQLNPILADTKTMSNSQSADQASRLIDTNFDPNEATTVNQYYTLLPYKYKFNSFSHPLVGELIIKVNGDGTESALSIDTQKLSRKLFVKSYRPTEEVSDDYPLWHFSFSDLDANGFYNYELFFHLPLLIAMRLSQNQQFAEAQKWFHLVFDPTSRRAGNGAQRYWQFKPFADLYDSTSGHPFDSIYDQLTALAADPATADAETLALKEQTEEQIAMWRANPFDPHAIAALRPVAYMKTVVMEYVKNLIAWGDYLFEQNSIESINEATQYYILAYQILGERPVAVPELEVVSQSYNELGELDAFSNAIAELESLINLPPSSDTGTVSVPPLYFCIPDNPNLLQLWDTIEDRLFKIRHCMNIEGIVQQLPLFQPPIPPQLLVAARASGVSIGAALASLATPAPHYRFVYLMQKAVEYCQVVKGLGNQLLSAYEKQDSEALGLLRSEHEQSLLKATTELRNLQVDEARENLSALEKSQTLVEERIEYYSNLEKRSEKEKSAAKNLDDAERQRKIAGDLSIAASISAVIPNFSTTIGGPIFSLETGVSFGGSNLASAFNAVSGGHMNASGRYNAASSKNLTDAVHDRRWDDWKLQERLAKKELKQVEKQIIAAEVRLAMAEKERDNHAIQLDQSREVNDFLSDKFTNQELYGWMISQTSAIYFQSYKLAYDLAKRCEKAFQRELGEYDSSYIAYGYFDSMKKGLLSGERLHHDLQRMEFDYLNTNRREYELTRHVSLAQLDPTALIALQETGECFINLPETLFDLDYPGHYFRRIKSVSLSIPSITGPYTSLSSTLTLQSDKVRVAANIDQGDEDDANMQFNLGALKSMATSSAQSDSGIFQLDFRDERYLPFEGSGVISEWKLQLNAPELAQFDYDTISDVIMHISYTARDGGEAFRSTVEDNLLSAIDDFFGDGQSLQQLISIKQNQPDEWARLNDASEDTEYALPVNLGLEQFPYYLRQRGITLTSVTIALKGDVDVNGWDPVELPELTGAGNTASFVEDASLGLAAANIPVNETIDALSETLLAKLPSQLVSAAGEPVSDILVIGTYNIEAV